MDGKPSIFCAFVGEQMMHKQEIHALHILIDRYFGFIFIVMITVDFLL